ncbi:hypothetical protein HRG_010562 [Hirsutella rhossiliensis]|uniref:Uncharacterized protein n=1 Tax=Hirsutella rhossiliensis TaxID=111463 RepID=A0A9P8SD59_9HYPO|nr:uncharacterized protein HRG_10562 [Hirsutella rhossiliensis]KAH0958261.1 hypothetical protein HRG_10562 [Hirsutella rhossiliensis]
MTDRSVVETEFYCSEDEDAKTPTARSGVLPDGERRRQLVRQGIDSDILAILDHKFLDGHNRCTILNSTGPDFCNPRTGQPAFVVITALQDALDRHFLNLDKKRTLFEILGWKFECLACHEIKAPADYQGTSYIFWGPEVPGSCYLRSGPCVACQEKARKSKHPQAGIVPYKVAYPE